MKFVYEELSASLDRFKRQPGIGFWDLRYVRQVKASFCQDEIQKKSLGLSNHLYSYLSKHVILLCRIVHIIFFQQEQTDLLNISFILYFTVECLSI